MLTLPDFKEKKILTVNTDFANTYYLQLQNDNIVFWKNKEKVSQISTHLVFAIFIVGEISITTSLIKKLNYQGISIFFLNQNLSLKASVDAEAKGNYLLRAKQYKTKNELEVAKSLLKQKIRSQEFYLKRAKKEIDENLFKKLPKKIENAEYNKELLGLEGSISRYYFQLMFTEIGWGRRAPQTKEDIPNLLLDIGYTYLFNYCDALLNLFGFDTYKGFFHKVYFQRKSLSCDVMEPFRPIIDYQVLKSFNLKQINKRDFKFRNGQFEFKEGFQGSKKYGQLFLTAISDEKEYIYNFVLGFYRYTMDNKKYSFPNFK